MKRTAKITMPEPVELPLPAPLERARRYGQVEHDLRLFTFGACRCLVGSSKAGWHLSISCADRYPTWDEVAHARYNLLPRDRSFAMILPPQAEYVNVHENCLHLWEIQPSRGQPLIVPGFVIDPAGNSIPAELLNR